MNSFPFEQLHIERGVVQEIMEKLQNFQLQSEIYTNAAGENISLQRKISQQFFQNLID